jgi:hypothetical protein
MTRLQGNGVVVLLLEMPPPDAAQDPSGARCGVGSRRAILPGVSGLAVMGGAREQV